MFGKVFQQMYDGTLGTAGPWEALVTFQQMIVLADKNGDVDLTMPALARRTTIPLSIIEKGIAALLEPDPFSRTPGEEGRRIVPLSEHRPWGWRIVNYLKYRDIKSEDERRAYHRTYYHTVRKLKSVEKVEGVELQQNSSASNHTEADTEAEAEVKKTSATRKRATPVPALSVADLESKGLTRETAEEFLALRRKKRAPLTPRAWEGIADEAEKAKWTIEQAIRKCLARGWQGFEAEWVKGERPVGAPQHVNRQEALEASNRAVGERWLANRRSEDASE